MNLSVVSVARLPTNSPIRSENRRHSTAPAAAVAIIDATSSGQPYVSKPRLSCRPQSHFRCSLRLGLQDATLCNFTARRGTRQPGTGARRFVYPAFLED